MKKLLLCFAAVICLNLPVCVCLAYGDDAVKIYEAVDLYNDIKNENLSFEFDDPVTVTGIVVETGISIYATPFISLSNEKDGTVYAICVLPRSDAFKLKEFSKGEKVTLQGNYYSFRDRTVIKKCKKM
jgi:hypothetical protein